MITNLERTNKYRVDSEEEAKNLIEKFREEASGNYILKKAGYEYKTKKAKGEIIGECWVVTATMVYGTLWEE